MNNKEKLTNCRIGFKEWFQHPSDSSLITSANRTDQIWHKGENVSEEDDRFDIWNNIQDVERDQIWDTGYQLVRGIVAGYGEIDSYRFGFMAEKAQLLGVFNNKDIANNYKVSNFRNNRQLIEWLSCNYKFSITDNGPLSNSRFVNDTTCFSDLDMRHVNLADLDLSRCVFRGADFYKAHLKDIDLAGANLIEANFKKSTLTNVDLSGVNLEGANLSFSNLSEVDLKRSNLIGSDLSGANLSGVNLTNAKMPEGWKKLVNRH